jgi:monoterpene epsilon-lactone hydrolase
MRPSGRIVRTLLNCMLRIAVKSWLGLHIDVSDLRKRLAILNNLVAHDRPGMRRERVLCRAVPAEWIIPDNCLAARVLFYVHGGAFVARTPDVHAAMLAEWSQALNARALMIDYRLAPEYPYPAALDDCLASYAWLLEQGVEPHNIAVAGDSAGGNLAMAALQRIKGEGLPLPACAVLLSPFLDFTLSGLSALINSRRDPVFNLAFGVGIRRLYAEPINYGDSGVSPLFGDFTGLPPILFQVGSTEMLLDDSVRAAAEAHHAGIPVQLEIWDQLPHVFQTLTGIPQAQAAKKSAVRFISGHTGWDVRLS